MGDQWDFAEVRPLWKLIPARTARYPALSTA
jgi:hypothetical protein